MGTFGTVAADALVLTPNEVAKMLRLSRNAIYAALASGDVPSIRVGHKILIPRAGLEAMLTVSTDKPTASQEMKIATAKVSLEMAIAKAKAHAALLEAAVTSAERLLSSQNGKENGRPPAEIPADPVT